MEPKRAGGKGVPCLTSAGSLTDACRDWEQRQRTEDYRLREPKRPALWWEMLIGALFRRR